MTILKMSLASGSRYSIATCMLLACLNVAYADFGNDAIATTVSIALPTAPTAMTAGRGAVRCTSSHPSITATVAQELPAMQNELLNHTACRSRDDHAAENQ